MIFNMNGGGGSGSTALNFKVVGGTTEPINPKGNTIWVNTDIEITDWIFSASEPETPGEGMVWLQTNTSSSFEFNALKKNGITVCLQSAKQYINGAWVEKSVRGYSGDEWLATEYIPQFTYTGNYEIVNDADELITTSSDNWKIRFLSSGTLTFTALNSASNGIDVFCVGGGGNGGNGGGGGGYTNTKKNVTVEETSYEIVVGGSGGESSAFNLKAGGGSSGWGLNGGYGGSGGSGGGSYHGGGGGSDGGNGGQGYEDGVPSGYKPGSGQRSASGPNGESGTTREFGEAGARLYAGGGGANGKGSGGAGGGGGANAVAVPNTGGGGHCAAGASGIVIIRNTRG